MKRLISLLIFCISIQAYNYDRELDLEYDIYNDVEIKEYFIQLEMDKKNDLIKDLRASKVSLITGELDTGLTLLKVLLAKYKDTPLSVLIKRYLALTYFVTGNYKRTLELLNDGDFQKISNFRNICIMKVASQLHLGPTIELKSDLTLCQITNQSFNNNDFIWLSHVEDYVYNKTKTEKFYKNLVLKLEQYIKHDHTLAWLKFGLLFDYEKLVLSNINLIPQAAYENDNIRVLMAYNYYKNKDIKNAKNFIEDINTSNAAYLKAVFSAQENDYKTAYAHTRSSLARRKYSINANQMMSSLAWLNEKWEEGRMALNKLPPTDELKREQRLLNLAYIVKEKNYFRAKTEIEDLYTSFNRKMPFEALVIESLIYLTLDNEKWVSSSDSACLRYDGVNCWLHLQSLIWKDYAKDIKRFESKKTKVLTKLEDMTMNKEAPKIEEPLFIHQRDIIELDIKEDKRLEDIRI